MTEAIRYPELRMMVRGTYDLQALRMQIGLRLVANFRAKLKVHDGEERDPSAPADPTDLDDDALDVLEQLKASYLTLTQGVARNRELPSRAGFIGNELIDSYAAAVLVNQYLNIEREEAKQFRQFEGLLADVPIYTDYLAEQRGVGPAMAGIMITTLDPHKARNVSSFWSFAGLDVAPDGRGRSRRQEHLVERKYINKNGEEATRVGVTYNPLLKTKLMGVLAGSFLRTGSEWRTHYDNYKHRLVSDPARVKITVGEWKKRYRAQEDVSNCWTPGRIDTASKRYMVKMFLADLWAKWRALEGLPVTPTYHEAKLGHRHGGEAAA